MYKVIFIIVPSFSSSNWLNDKMLQITESFISILNVDEYPVYVVENYNDINRFLDKANIIVVATAGTVIVERDHLWKKINEFPLDIGLMTHLLQFENDVTPYMHEQFFIINTSAVKHIDLTFIPCEDEGIELIRSDEDLHDGHAPLFISLGKDLVNRRLQFGTMLIEHVLQNGYEVRNFDLGWRYPAVPNDYFNLDDMVLPTKGFCYPMTSTEIFEKSLKDMKSYPGLDEAQDLFIRAMKKIFEFKVLNYWHYDQIPDIVDFNHVISPATGFLAEMTAIRCGAKKITFYDKNYNNLDFKKHLYENWDGERYNEFAVAWAKQKNLSLEPSFGIDKEMTNDLINDTEINLFSIWNGWRKSISVDFIYGDLLLTDYIIDSITDKTIFHTSTILGRYPFTAIIHDRSTIKNVELKLIKKIEETNSRWIKSP